MRKHDSLRAALVTAFPELDRDRERLAIYIERGSIASRFAEDTRSGGFEWRYTLTAVLLDFVGDTNLLAASVLDWLQVHQPELLLNHAAGNEAISFRVDVLDQTKADVEIEIALTEAVDIDAAGATSYRDEPVPAEAFADVPAGTVLDAITINGEGLMP